MNIKLTLVPLIAAVATFAVAPANSANACKGLSKSACDGSTACSWVKGYTRKDGREVAAYCRIKSSGKSAARPDAKAAPAS